MNQLKMVENIFFFCTYYLAFVDYSKAFDTVEHSSVLQALHRQGIESKYVKVLKIYRESYAKVKTEL